MITFKLINKLIIAFLFISFSQTLSSQESVLYRNYTNNNLYNINPAAAGYDGYLISQLTISKNWVGVTDSPSGQLFSNSIRLGQEGFYDENMFINRLLINIAPRVGLGASVFNDVNGPLRHTGFLAAYAYHISFRENHLSFGLSGVVSQYHLNVKDFKPIDPGDPDLYTNTQTIIPDVNIGVLYYNRKIFAGISANGLINFNKTFDHTKTSPDIIICGGYKLEINSTYTFEPSVYLWKYGNGAFSGDINCKLYFRKKNSILLSYQGIGEVLTGIGISIRPGIQLFFSYAFGTSGFSRYSSGNQSISIRTDMASLIQKINKR